MFPVAKKFMDKRGGEYQDFPSNFSCLSVPKNAIGEPLSLSLISGIEKVWMRGWGGGGVKIFRRKFLVSQCRKIFVGQPFRVSPFSGIEKVYASEGYVTIFCRNFLSHSDEMFVGEPLCCVSGSQKGYG